MSDRHNEHNIRVNLADCKGEYLALLKRVKRRTHDQVNGKRMDRFAANKRWARLDEIRICLEQMRDDEFDKIIQRAYVTPYKSSYIQNH